MKCSKRTVQYRFFISRDFANIAVVTLVATIVHTLKEIRDIEIFVTTSGHSLENKLTYYLI